MKKLKYIIILALLLVFWPAFMGIEEFRRFVSTPINVAKGMATGVEMHNLASVMEASRVLNGHYPRDYTEFERVVLDNYPSGKKSPLTDHWGQLYSYVPADDDYGARIVSWGPDRRSNTKDDLFYFLER